MLRRTRLHGPLAVLLLSTLSLSLAGCSVNPATGKQQLNLYSEAEEIEMGKQADEEIVASVGLYEDPELQDYVADLGMQIASSSERPHLPWSFKIVDDPAVNAFALPGGYVYITRGLLTHLESEAELVAVLGHEVGHVTARHGVNQASKQALAMAGVGIGLAIFVDPDVEDLAGIAAGLGMSLLFLKYGRDDERQADDLGLRYVVRTGHDPRQMPELFSVLEGVEKVAGVGRLPNWLSTHPNPGARRERIQKEVAALQEDFSQAVVNRDGYLRHLDGAVFGDNPRNGYFAGKAFLHPELRFQIEFPEGWETANETTSVSASPPGGNATVQVSLSEKDTPDEAADALFSEEGVTRGKSWEKRVHGMPAHWDRFDYADGESKLRGTVAFVQHEGKVFQLLAMAAADEWKDNQEAMEEALATFSQLDDPEALKAQPNRLKLVEIRKEMTLEEFNRQYPSVVEMPMLALINHVQPTDKIPAGSLVKRIVTSAP
jgi:predicted Zn-dependent protease